MNDCTYLTRNNYLFRLYLQRGPHKYFRCSNRKDKCPCRLSLNTETNEEKIKGTHLPTCVQVNNNEPIPVHRRRTRQFSATMIESSSTDNIGIATIPAELKITNENQPFLQYAIFYPYLLSIFFTEQAKEFGKTCKYFAIYQSHFCPPPFKTVYLLFGYNKVDFRFLSLFILSEPAGEPFRVAINYIASQFPIANSPDIVMHICLDPDIVSTFQKNSLKWTIKTTFYEIEKNLRPFFLSYLANPFLIDHAVGILRNIMFGCGLESFLESFRNGQNMNTFVSFLFTQTLKFLSTDMINLHGHDEFDFNSKLYPWFQYLQQFETSHQFNNLNDFAALLREMEEISRTLTLEPAKWDPPRSLAQLIIDSQEFDDIFNQGK